MENRGLYVQWRSASVRKETQAHILYGDDRDNRNIQYKERRKRYFAPIHLQIAHDCFNKIYRPATAPRWPTSLFAQNI